MIVDFVYEESKICLFNLFYIVRNENDIEIYEVVQCDLKIICFLKGYKFFYDYLNMCIEFLFVCFLFFVVDF